MQQVAPQITIKSVGFHQLALVDNTLQFPVTHWGEPEGLWLVFSNSSPTPIGAACLWLMPNQARFWIRIDTQYQGRGIGRVLLSQIEKLAQGANKKDILPAKFTSHEATQFLAKLGYRIVNTLTSYRLTFENGKKLVTPVFHRMQKHNKIPDNAEIINFIEAKKRNLQQEIASIIVENLGGRFDRVLGRVSGNLNTFNPDYCFAVLQEGKPIAVITSRYSASDDIWIFPSFVVIPNKRSGWASVWLRHHWGLVIEETGRIADLGFDVSDQYTDTTKFAKRTQAKLYDRKYSCVKKLG